MRAMLIEAMGATDTVRYEYDPSLSEAENKRRATDHVESVLMDIQQRAFAADWDPYAPPESTATEFLEGGLTSQWRNRGNGS